MRKGRSSLVVKVTNSEPACHEFQASVIEDPPRRGANAFLNFRGSKLACLNAPQNPPCRIAEVIYPIEWLATLTAVSFGQGLNRGEDMDVFKCIVPSRQRGTLNSRRAASPLVMLVEGKKRWDALTTPREISLIIGRKLS
ncbi:hypothetical protein TNCV_4290841 [Trichonephila clavipes]|nr:hypothetical protein TNCV_4290841 [Trichonephila clavipes]